MFGKGRLTPEFTRPLTQRLRELPETPDSHKPALAVFRKLPKNSEE